MISSTNVRAAQIILSDFMDIEIVPRIKIPENYVWIMCGFSQKILQMFHIFAWKSQSIHKAPVLFKSTDQQPFGPTVMSTQQLCPRPQGWFTKWRWTGCRPDLMSACSPMMSWSTSPHLCWCRHRRHLRPADCWAAGQRCSYAWFETEQHYDRDADNVCFIFQPFLLPFLVFTWSHSSGFWAGSGAARWPPAAHPGLSAASSCCAPVGRSPPRPHPSAASTLSGADST